MKLRLAALAAVILLSACRHAGDITAENGGGVYAVRSDCPIAGIPAGTGDITLFNPAEARIASDRRDRGDHASFARPARTPAATWSRP